MTAGQESLPYRIEPMTVGHLDGVMEIENVAHPSPWPASAYRHELEQNNLSHYFVLLAGGEESAGPSGLRERLRHWLGSRPPSRPLVAYGGFWMMVGEAHISTIAVHPAWRGKGLGELMLLAMIEEAARLDATLVTLEVRISNTTAQQLYEKYSFEYVGRRKRYYRDNKEDAHIMTVEDVQSADYRAFLAERRRQLAERLAARERSDSL